MKTRHQRGARSRRWTKAEFYRLAELGFFHGQRVELIEGRLVVQSPQNSLHADTVDSVSEVLRDLFGAGHRIRTQLPLDLGQKSELEPDLAVVVGLRKQFQGAHPTNALLIVEVADSTLTYDRGPKASFYARAGILDYWIINLVDRQVEVYRDPQLDATQPYGFRYGSRVDVVVPASVAPLVLPQSSVSVADLLP